MYIRTSFQYGILCLKKVNYDTNELQRRRDQTANEIKGECFPDSFLQNHFIDSYMGPDLFWNLASF